MVVGWGRMEKISWVNTISNEEVLAKVEEGGQIMKIIQQRHHWTGCILRHQNFYS